MRPLLLIILASSLIACSNQMPFNENAVPVFASAETFPVQSNEDAADDPAIWINTNKPENSLVLGTDKKNGLAVYNLKGEQVQFLSRGKINNVDLRQMVPINGDLTTLASATNRTENTLDIFTISNDGTLEFIFAQPLTFTDPYGICMSLDSSGNAYAFANSKDGEYQQWLLNPNGNLKPTLVGRFKLASQPEGCVVNDINQTLYLGEENLGIWKMPADANKANEMQLFDQVNQGHLVDDVEGMDIYHGQQGQTWLVVSSQGDFSYAVYDLNTENQGSAYTGSAYVGSIRITDNIESGIDGAEETDGLAVTSANLGGVYSQGLLVVQDGYNRLPKENQNFKLVSWQQVIEALKLK